MIVSASRRCGLSAAVHVSELFNVAAWVVGPLPALHEGPPPPPPEQPEARSASSAIDEKIRPFMGGVLPRRTRTARVPRHLPAPRAKSIASFAISATAIRSTAGR